MPTTTTVSAAHAMVACGDGRRRRGLVIAAAGSAAALVAAWTLQTLGGMSPCPLCLLERWPYWVALLLGCLGLAAPATVRGPIVWCAFAALFGGAILAVLHLGVEQGWWPDPIAACAAQDLGAATSERLARMPTTPALICGRPTYVLPSLPLSLAAMNLAYAAVCGGLVFMSARR